MYAITGASGHLGRLAVAALAGRVAADRIVALVRDPAKAGGLPAGVVVRAADYDRPETLAPALAGVERLLLVSSNAVGRRVPQHRAVIDAAVAAGVALLAYTSILHADTTPLGLAPDHRETEALLAASGLAVALLRNGWYTENYLVNARQAVADGVFQGAAGQGRIASAARRDYAEGAAAALLAAPESRTYELAGDEAFTLAELAAELARQAGRTVAYRDLPPPDYRAALATAGVPDGLADLLVDSDEGVAKGALFDDGGDLHRLIGRPTTPLSDMVAAALASSAGKTEA